LIAKAQADDKSAFQELLKLQNGTNSPMSQLAEEAIGAIVISLMAKHVTFMNAVLDPWAGSNLKPETASPEDFQMMLNKPHTVFDKLRLLHDLFNQERFDEDMRFATLLNFLRTDANLYVANEICLMLGEKTRLNLNIMGKDEYFAWFLKRLDAKAATKK
jgi:hypothetical protein